MIVKPLLMMSTKMDVSILMIARPQKLIKSNITLMDKLTEEPMEPMLTTPTELSYQLLSA